MTNYSTDPILTPVPCEEEDKERMFGSVALCIILGFGAMFGAEWALMKMFPAPTDFCLLVSLGSAIASFFTTATLSFALIDYVQLKLCPGPQYEKLNELCAVCDMDTIWRQKFVKEPERFCALGCSKRVNVTRTKRYVSNRDEHGFLLELLSPLDDYQLQERRYK